MKSSCFGIHAGVMLAGLVPLKVNDSDAKP
jgi:hypothetical protein